MNKLAAALIAAGIFTGGIAHYSTPAEANGANSRNSQCGFFKRKAAFAKTAKEKAKFRKLHQQCLRNGG